MTKEERLDYLQDHFSGKIIEIFAQGIPDSMKEASPAFRKGISYEEAVKILGHTISQLKKMPILF